MITKKKRNHYLKCVQNDKTIKCEYFFNLFVHFSFTSILFLKIHSNHLHNVLYYILKLVGLYVRLTTFFIVQVHIQVGLLLSYNHQMLQANATYM